MRKFFLAICIFCVAFAQARAYTPEKVPNPKDEGQTCCVANPDHILTDSTTRWLNHCASMLYDSTHVELCVVAVTSIGKYEAFDFAYELFQRWGIGRAGQNTGVLILFVLKTHDLRIMTGTGIEGVLTDAQCSKIMHDDMFPAFKREEYDLGLCLGVLRIYEICTSGDAPEELLTIRSATNRGEFGKDWRDNDYIEVGIVVGMFLLIIYLIWMSYVKRCPKCHRRRAHLVKRHTIKAATEYLPGREELTYCCRRCGHTFTRTQTILSNQMTGRRSGSSGGGSFSSGSGSWGGGSTSGGGAGGKW